MQTKKCMIFVVFIMMFFYLTKYNYNISLDTLKCVYMFFINKTEVTKSFHNNFLNFY